MALKHAEPGEVVDLSPLGDAIGSTKTHALVKRPDFEAIRMIVPKGVKVPTHEVPGDVTLYALEGRVRLERPNGPVELGQGDWLYLEGREPHSLTGLEDATLLLTIMFRP